MYKIAAIAWFGVVNYLFFSPSTGIPSISFFQFKGSDKLIHGLLFFVGTLIYTKAFAPKYTSTKMLGFYLFIYGVLVEFAQEYFTTTRSFDWIDILADAIGIAFALIFISKLTVLKNNQNAKQQ